VDKIAKKEAGLSWNEEGKAFISFKIPDNIEEDGVIHFIIQPADEIDTTITHPVPVSKPKTIIDFIPETGFLHCIFLSFTIF
jgi:hypothetical protein